MTFDELIPVTGSALRLLAAVCRVHGRGELPTFQVLCDELGIASKNGLYGPLAELTAAGLIRRERRKYKTIVPLGSFEITPAAFKGRKRVTS